MRRKGPSGFAHGRALLLQVESCGRAKAQPGPGTVQRSHQALPEPDAGVPWSSERSLWTDLRRQERGLPSKAVEPELPAHEEITGD